MKLRNDITSPLFSFSREVALSHKSLRFWLGALLYFSFCFDKHFICFDSGSVLISRKHLPSGTSLRLSPLGSDNPTAQGSRLIATRLPNFRWAAGNQEDPFHIKRSSGPNLSWSGVSVATVTLRQCLCGCWVGLHRHGGCMYS